MKRKTLINIYILIALKYAQGEMATIGDNFNDHVDIRVRPWGFRCIVIVVKLLLLFMKRLVRFRADDLEYGSVVLCTIWLILSFLS